MSAPIERHSQEVWRKTAEQLNGDGFSVGGDDSPGKDVNKNGAPLLGDSRDLFVRNIRHSGAAGRIQVARW